MKAIALLSSLLLLLLAPAATAATENLLVNPGFEEGTQNDAPPWAVGGWRGSDRATTDEHHTGRRSLQLQGGGDEDAINSFLQWVPIDPTGATKYHLKVWMKIPSATADAPKDGRTRWIFDNGPSDGLVTSLSTPDWTQIDSGDKDIITAPGSQFMAFRTYVLIGHLTAYVDDVELTSEPSGQPTYPGVTGTVKDQNGKPLAGAFVFLKSAPKAQEFATDANGNGGSSRATDDTGTFTVCVKGDGTADGTYYVVAWKQGYGISAEQTVTITSGAPLVTFNPVLTKSSSGRNLAISTAARPTAFADINVGRIDDPHYKLSYMFDGNNFTTRYENRASEEPADQRWVYVDLDPVGKKTFSVNEFVLYGLGITAQTQGSLGGEGTPPNFTIEYTTKDPATETEAGWTANTAFTATDVKPTIGPSVMRIPSPITARAVRFHATTPGAWFGPVEFQVNSDTLARGSITGVVKDATTGAPIAGAHVALFQPVHIQNDADVYGLGTPVPYVVAEEVRNGTPYEFDQAKNTQQIAVTDATGTYTLDADAGQPVKVSVRVTGYPYTVASVTPPDDGSAATQNFNLGKEYIVSGVVKDATGPIYNAVVQIGGASSKGAVVTGTDGKYSLVVGAGSQELYADAFGHAGHVETINVAADLAKDITLTTQAEPGSLSADFETLGDWEIGHFDTNWVSVGIGTRAAKVDGGQNTTPGGKSSALIEDIKSVDNASTELTDPTYEVLQRPSSKRIAVTAGNSYNVYFKLKIENWVITDTTKDCVHYVIRWLDANGAVLDRIYSHPFWIFPQTFWQQYSVGHPAGSDGSVALVRLSPPAGAAFLDLKIGWIRHNSGIDDANPDGTNPAGTQLFVDDLVVDAFASGGGGTGATISAARTADGLSITFTGTLESANDITGPWTPVQGATSPFAAKADQTSRFYRSRAQ